MTLDHIRISPRRHVVHSLLVCSVTAVTLAGCASATPSATGLTVADSAAIEALRARYQAAWLNDDTTGVLATLEPTAVLIPPSTSPRVGADSIRAYWWPTDGSTTLIRGFTWTAEDLWGAGDLAVSRGESTVAWSYRKGAVAAQDSSRSRTLSIFRRQPSGEWLIARQMWMPAK